MDWMIQKFLYPPEVIEFINSTFDLVEIRGKVGEVAGIDFHVYSNEANHTVPHVHAKFGGLEVSIEISDEAKVLVGNLPPKKLKVARKWIIANKNKLLTDWSTLAISAKTSCMKSLLNDSEL